MNVLVIGAHPDDEIIGLGGTLRKHIKLGHRVYVHLLTDGESSRNNIEMPEVSKKRKTSAHRACEALGIHLSDIFIDDYPDQKLDTIPVVELVKRIEKIKEIARPNVVYCHHHGDVNRDHQVVYQAALTAFRPVGEYVPREFYAFETMSSTEWSGPNLDLAFVPNHFVDISNEMADKLNALKAYDQEMRNYPHPRSFEGIEIAARRWGTLIGVTHAEAFVTIRSIW